MDKNQLIDRLRNLPFDKAHYWLAAGGAMVIYGFRDETRDIDLGCSTELADELEKQGYPISVLKDGTRRIAYSEDVEIYEDWLMDKVVVQDDIPVVSVDGLIAMKKNLGREKDYRDIELINRMRKEVTEK